MTQTKYSQTSIVIFPQTWVDLQSGALYTHPFLGIQLPFRRIKSPVTLIPGYPQLPAAAAVA